MYSWVMQNAEDTITASFATLDGHAVVVSQDNHGDWNVEFYSRLQGHGRGFCLETTDLVKLRDAITRVLDDGSPTPFQAVTE